MKKLKSKNQIVIICFSLFVFLLFSFPALALTSAQDGLNKTAIQGFGSGDEADVAETGIMTSIPTAIGRIIGVALSFVGALFLLLMIYGGFTWMMARGNEAEVTKAKDLITAAVIGLVIVLAAYAITAFVGEQLTTTP